jgi:hypothetical protein
MTSIPARVMAADQNDLKPSIRPGHSFDRTVVLLHDIVQVLYLAEFDAGFNVGVVHFYRRGVGATLDDGDLLRRTPLVDGFAEEAGSCFAVPLGSEKECRNPVSTSRSSNRTCRLPASGSRTRHHAFAFARLVLYCAKQMSPKYP